MSAYGSPERVAEHAAALLLVTTRPTDRALAGWAPAGPGWNLARTDVQAWAGAAGERAASGDPLVTGPAAGVPS